VRFDDIECVDVAIDGIDQVADGRLIKWGGAAHTREKIVASAAIGPSSSSRRTSLWSAWPPVPLVLHESGIRRDISHRWPLRPGTSPPRPAKSRRGVIADFFEPIHDPVALAASVDTIPGIVEHGLFPPPLVSDVIVGSNGRAEHLPASSGWCRGRWHHHLKVFRVR
jgi:ribose 5-phosphate isomerase A